MPDTNFSDAKLPQTSYVLVIGTGGTIAGTASAAEGDANYTSAQLGVAQLLAAVPALQAVPLRTQQIAQVDSKDMGAALWCDLAAACAVALADDAVQGIVVTHGTDTLEETASWLYLTLPNALLKKKPLVLTCAMRPATSAEADGPQNLADAVSLALQGGKLGLTGVMLASAGEIHHGLAVRKIHSHRVAAFSSGDWPLLGAFQAPQKPGLSTILMKNQPTAMVFSIFVAIKNEAVATNHKLSSESIKASGLPWVEIIHSHAGADGRVLDRLFANASDAPQGLIVAGTGNGTVHANLLEKLEELQANRQIAIRRSTRCILGAVTPRDDDTIPVTPLPPAKARVAMQVMLLGKA